MSIDIYIYIYMYICIFICIHMYTYLYVCIYTYIYICLIYWTDLSIQECYPSKYRNRYSHMNTKFVNLFWADICLLESLKEIIYIVYDDTEEKLWVKRDCHIEVCHKIRKFQTAIILQWRNKLQNKQRQIEMKDFSYY